MDGHQQLNRQQGPIWPLPQPDLGGGWHILGLLQRDHHSEAVRAPQQRDQKHQDASDTPRASQGRPEAQQEGPHPVFLQAGISIK